MGISASVEMAPGDVAALNHALEAYAGAMGRAAEVAPKVAACAICDSLGKNTKKAPKRMRPGEYAASVSVNRPNYITYKGGQKLVRPLHRWTLRTKVGTQNEHVRDYFVYTHTKTVRGKNVPNRSAELAELKKNHTKIFHAGLAKQSWRWVKRAIAKGSKDAVWKRRQGDKRDPTRSVNGSYRKSGSCERRGAEADIRNSLDYIEKALAPVALSEAMRKAAASTAWKAATKRGMTPEDAAKYARELVEEHQRRIAAANS